jgi:hypothetical protein
MITIFQPWWQTLTYPSKHIFPHTFNKRTKEKEKKRCEQSSLFIKQILQGRSCELSKIIGVNGKAGDFCWWKALLFIYDMDEEGVVPNAKRKLHKLIT